MRLLIIVLTITILIIIEITVITLTFTKLVIMALILINPRVHNLTLPDQEQSMWLRTLIGYHLLYREFRGP